jgi:hypothetical protein
MDRDTAVAMRDQILAQNDPVTAAAMLGELFLSTPEFLAALHGQEIAPGVRIQNPGPDAARMTERMMRKVAGAAQDYVTGMQNPRRDPKQSAIRAKGKWANNVQLAITQNRYEAGVRNYDQAEAVTIATSDGGSAYTSGVAKRHSKIGRVHQKLAPLLGAVSQAIQAMPQDNEGQREARMLATVRAMRNVGKQMKGISGGIAG